jgi:hypothetical protein
MNGLGTCLSCLVSFPRLLMLTPLLSPPIPEPRRTTNSRDHTSPNETGTSSNRRPSLFEARHISRGSSSGTMVSGVPTIRSPDSGRFSLVLHGWDGDGCADRELQKISCLDLLKLPSLRPELLVKARYQFVHGLDNHWVSMTAKSGRLRRNDPGRQGC